jgi:hypothetical protein
MGRRFRLKADFDISRFSPEVRVILTALKKYGMILADNGSAWYISGAPDERWDNDVLVGELRSILGSDFEAVDESSLMVSPDSGQARQTDSDRQPPSAPTGLKATVVSSTRIDLSWIPSAVNVAVSGYFVYRNNTHLATTENTGYQNSGLTPSTSYTYRVAAFDSAGNVSAQSGAVTQSTLAALSTVFKPGDLVRTSAKTSVRAAPSASGRVLGNQPKGALGTVVEGPVYWNSQWWWSVDFVRSPDGWVAETRLRKAG